MAKHKIPCGCTIDTATHLHTRCEAHQDDPRCVTEVILDHYMDAFLAIENNSLKDMKWGDMSRPMGIARRAMRGEELLPYEDQETHTDRG